MARKRKIVNTIVCQDFRRLPSLSGWNKIGPAGATGSMSADLFDFHRGGDGVERMTDGEKRKLTLLNPMRNVGFAVSLFFYGVTSFRGVFSASPSGSADVSQEDITGCELSLMGGHSATPEYEMLSWRRRGRTGLWWMMTMWELLLFVFYFTFVTFNAKQKLSVIHLSTTREHASCQVFCTWTMDVWKYHLREETCCFGPFFSAVLSNRKRKTAESSLQATDHDCHLVATVRKGLYLNGWRVWNKT